jgi:L-ribulokinase
MWNANWGGYPDAAFLSKLDPKLGKLRDRLTPCITTVDRAVGGLTASWAKRTGTAAGIPGRRWARWMRISAPVGSGLGKRI